jgi:hypothetical protein
LVRSWYNHIIYVYAGFNALNTPWSAHVVLVHKALPLSARRPPDFKYSQILIAELRAMGGLLFGELLEAANTRAKNT